MSKALQNKLLCVYDEHKLFSRLEKEISP